MSKEKKKVDPAISLYFSELSRKRKNKVGGFKSDAVQQKIREQKQLKSQESAQGESQTNQASQAEHN